MEQVDLKGFAETALECAGKATDATALLRCNMLTLDLKAESPLVVYYAAKHCVGPTFRRAPKKNAT